MFFGEINNKLSPYVVPYLLLAAKNKLKGSFGILIQYFQEASLGFISLSILIS